MPTLNVTPAIARMIDNSISHCIAGRDIMLARLDYMGIPGAELAGLN